MIEKPFRFKIKYPFESGSKKNIIPISVKAIRPIKFYTVEGPFFS